MCKWQVFLWSHWIKAKFHAPVWGCLDNNNTGMQPWCNSNPSSPFKTFKWIELKFLVQQYTAIIASSIYFWMPSVFLLRLRPTTLSTVVVVVQISLQLEELSFEFWVSRCLLLVRLKWTKYHLVLSCCVLLISIYSSTVEGKTQNLKFGSNRHNLRTTLTLVRVVAFVKGVTKISNTSLTKRLKTQRSCGYL